MGTEIVQVSLLLSALGEAKREGGNIRKNLISEDIVSRLEACWDLYSPLATLVDKILLCPDLGVVVDARLLDLDPAERCLVHSRARSAALSHVCENGTIRVWPRARAP